MINDLFIKVKDKLGQYLLRIRHKKLVSDERTKCRVIYSDEHISNIIWLNGFYEKVELDLIIEYLKEKHPQIFNHSVIDVGANIGNHCCFFANYFKKVIAFEPNNENFKLLQLNTSALQNVVINNKGVSNKNFDAVFSQIESNMGKIRLETKQKEGIFTKCITLDDYLTSNLDKVALIKIDVEGHELEVLQGAKKTIRKNRPILCIEILANNRKSIQILELLRELGYKKFYSVDREPKDGFRLIRILKICFGFRISLKPLQFSDHIDYPIVICEW